MKEIRIHHIVIKEIDDCSLEIKEEFSQAIDLLIAETNLGMPLSRPMPIVAHGAHELRLHDRNGQVRVFYYTKMKDRILIFHFYRKKTATMPKQEIHLAQKRLKDLL